MKNIYLIGVLLIGLFSIGCDDVDPYGDYTFTPATGDPMFDDTTVYDSNLTARKIFLEEFTGHDCPNCPAGTALANSIKATHPDRVVLIAIHNSRNFSKPKPDAGLPSDFETETGDRLLLRYNPLAFPMSMIARVQVNGNYGLFPSSWENTVNTYVSDSEFSEPYFDVRIVKIFNSETNSIRLRPEISTLKAFSGEVRIGAYIDESGIEAPQNDQSTIIPDYIHNHVLRVGFPNHGEGKTVFTDPQVGDTYSTISTSDELVTFIDTEKWKLENLELIVYLYDSSTGEVLWVDYMHVDH